APAELVDGGDSIIAPLPQGAPVGERLESLLRRLAELREQAAPLAARKSDLMASAARPNFWDNREQAQALYDEIWRIDGIFAALDSLERAARDEMDVGRGVRTAEREEQAGSRPTPGIPRPSPLEERLEALESQARHAAFLVTCREGQGLGDAVLTLTLVASHGTDLNAVGMLGQMYAALARRRGLE